MPHILAAAVAVAAAAFVQKAPPPPVMPRPVVSQCPAADNAKYGLTAQDPVQVGGGAMNGPARERRYLEALRGPDGQPIRYKRLGSALAPDGETILDSYELTYEGLDKPIVVFVDEYHFGDLRVPQGFVCGQPIALYVPPADPLQIAEAVVAVAIEQGASHDFPPIPLDADGATTHGVAYDQFRLIARAARAAAAAGTTLTTKTVPRETARPRTIVLAYPLGCEGRTIAPAAITIAGAQGTAVRLDGDYAKDAAIATLLPGVQAPASSLAAAFLIAGPRANDVVKITYAEPCGGSSEAALPMRLSEPRTLDTPTPSLPEGAAPADGPVRLQALVDLDGALQHATYLGGPAHLARAAIDAVSRWRSEPPRINGAPVVRGVIVQVRFKP